jgi:uncharacterized Zn-binding protein involved in type VI secretion
MGKKVFANGMEIAHKAGSNKVLAAFPDVCMSPPSPPAGPIPLPYPDTSMAGDLKEGSKSVKLGGQPAALHGQSYYKTSPLGDEPATKSFGASVVTGGITGKTFFQASSMDVVFEGKKVNRHLDITTSNHGSQPGATPPMPGLESMSTGGGGDEDEDKPKCPCCGDDAHANQVGPDGKLSPTKKEAEYYDGKATPFMARRDEMQQVLGSAKVPGWANRPGADPNPLYNGLATKDIIINKGNDYEKIAKDLKALRAGNKDCPNVHEPPDEGCGTHFEPNGKAGEARVEFDKVRLRYLKGYNAANPGATVPLSSQVDHKTPLDAGGCPVSDTNLIPDPVLSGPCAQIESLQTKLQSL